MQQKCEVCGVVVGIIRWRSRKRPVYCSIRCNIIGQVKYTFRFAVFLGVVAIGFIIAGIVTPRLTALLIIFGIITGVLSIVMSLLSTLGFYFQANNRLLDRILK